MSALSNIEIKQRQHRKNMSITQSKSQLKAQGQVQPRQKLSDTKVIKRYQNRKLYDTQKSCYVTLDNIARMIRDRVRLIIVDNKTKADITASTLIQIIFDAEKKSNAYAPLSILCEMIRNGNGSMSSYLAKLGVFDPKKEAPVHEYVYDLIAEKGPRSYSNNVKPSLLTDVHTSDDHQEATVLTPGHQNHLEKIIPTTSTHHPFNADI